MEEKTYLPQDFIYNNDFENPMIFTLLEGSAEIYLKMSQKLHFIKNIKVLIICNLNKL